MIKFNNNSKENYKKNIIRYKKNIKKIFIYCFYAHIAIHISAVGEQGDLQGVSTCWLLLLDNL